MLQIAPRSRLTYIAAIRDGQDFTERDRVVVNLLQPHLSQAYRNARAFSALSEEVRVARKLADSFDRGVVVRSRSGGVRFSTARARTWLNEYFLPPRETGRLPALLEDWLEHRIGSLGKRDSLPQPMQPFIVERHNQRLVVHALFEDDQTILVLAEERTGVDAKLLQSLGLTPREAEVAAWVAEGRTNAEIGEILGARPLTVKKHLEHIFEKLGVENRTAAARLILSQRRTK
jgi:DNA-binding CsgD family transcriptional regulator